MHIIDHAAGSTWVGKHDFSLESSRKRSEANGSDMHRNRLILELSVERDGTNHSDCGGRDECDQREKENSLHIESII